MDAQNSIQCGQADIVVASSVECMSDYPIFYSRQARKFLHKINKAKSAPAIINIFRDFRAKRGFLLNLV